MSVSKVARYVTLGLLVGGCTSAATSGAESPRAGGSEGALGPGFALSEGDTVVENAKTGLARTYWAVVRSKEGSHYLLPRPDGASALAKACEASTPLATQLEGHALCKSADSEAAVAKVNALDEALALEVSTVLHRELSFRREGESITPSPLGRDLLELCRTNDELSQGAMKERCAEELKYADGGARPAIFRMWTEAELEAVPPALNALYGVK